LALGAWASAAQAEPLSMTFTEARADVGRQLSATDDADALLKPPATAPFDAQIDPGSGSIADGVMEVPDFTTFITDPIEADVTVAFELGTVTGNFNQASGALTLSGVAGGTLTAEGKECAVSTTPSPLTLTTAGSTGGASPLFGTPFAAGLTGAGAIAGQWTDMDATPISGHDSFCENVEDEIDGPGGVWLEQEGEIAPPSAPTSGPPPTDGGPLPPPPPAACVVPKLRGKTPVRARAAVRAGGCKVGRLGRPRQLKKCRGRRVLVVRSSNPQAGARPANRKVHLKLKRRCSKTRGARARGGRSR
jgi:hypothetical protein